MCANTPYWDALPIIDFILQDNGEAMTLFISNVLEYGGTNALPSGVYYEKDIPAFLFGQPVELQLAEHQLWCTEWLTAETFLRESA